MTNKRLVYVLLPAAAVVWGLIGYRVWQAVEADTEQAVANARPVSAAAPIAAARTPKLSLAYRDPFRTGTSAPQRDGLGANNASERIPSTNSRPLAALPVMNVAPPKPAAVPVTWPAVEFLGTIENKQNHRRIALLAISGQQTSLAETQATQGVKVLRVYKDSVQAEFHQQRRVFKLNSEGGE